MEQESGSETGTGAETQSGATASGTTESGSTVTEIQYPERLIAEYSYDVFGRRVSKALSDRVVSYSYDGQRIVEETVTDLSGNVLRSSEFVYGAAGDDDVLAEFRTESGTTAALYFMKDRLGSTAAVTDASGNVLEEYRHSAFGSPYRKLPDGTWEALGSETETLSGTVRPEPLTDRLYTGREWDSETGLHHYRARTYSPELGRFLQRDPVGTADQMNPYAYVRNNPLVWTDPTGMWREDIQNGKYFSNINPWENLATLWSEANDGECPFTTGKEMIKDAYSATKTYISAHRPFQPFPVKRGIEVAKQSDEVKIVMTSPYNAGYAPKIHTEVSFFKDGQPIATFGLTPIAGWSEGNLTKIDGGMTYVSTDKVYDCMEGISSGLTGNGIGICWNGALSCIGQAAISDFEEYLIGQ